MNTNRPTPLQIADAKAACGGAVLLFRMADFYEAFGEDARTLSIFCGLTIQRDRAGFPAHQLESRLTHLVAKGCRVAICEKTDYVTSAVVTQAVESAPEHSQRELFPCS